MQILLQLGVCGESIILKNRSAQSTGNTKCCAVLCKYVVCHLYQVFDSAHQYEESERTKSSCTVVNSKEDYNSNHVPATQSKHGVQSSYFLDALCQFCLETRVMFQPLMSVVKGGLNGVFVLCSIESTRKGAFGSTSQRIAPMMRRQEEQMPGI